MNKILIVENTIILGIKLKQILERNNFKNIEIINEPSFYYWKNGKNFVNVELLLIDLDFPGIDAIEMVRLIKKEKGSGNMPVIFIGSRVNVSILKEIIGIGDTGFLLKPFESEILINKIYAMKNKDFASKKENNFSTFEIFEEPGVILEWTKDFEIGNKEIDHEHRLIIEKFTKLYYLMSNNGGKEFYYEILDFLSFYINIHFEHEEALQLSIGYDKYNEHKKLHNEFKCTIIQIMDKHRAMPITNADLITLSLYVKDWLIYHILIEDKKIMEFMQK